jgi:hypothetical protein
MSRANISEPFDRHAFDRAYRPFPVRSISWEDYRHCHMERHAPQQARKGGYPEWLNSNSKIKQVISFALAGHDTDSLDELHLAAFERWRRWFVTNWKTHEGRRRYIAVQSNGGIEKLYAKLIWQWRIGRNSRDMAEATGMSRVGCRQILHRMNRVALRLFPEA